MKIVRSILGMIVGMVVVMFLITASETINFLVFRPADAPSLGDTGKLMEWMAEFQKDEEKVCAWIKELPIQGMLYVLLAWELAAFIGAWLAARIAGWAPLVHAGLIGALVLVGTAINFNELNKKGIPHPDWMVILGLLMPLPISLLAGKLVAARIAPSMEPPHVSNP